MRTISFTEFRRQASAMLDRVEKGETIQIERHGKVVAVLARPEPGPLRDPGPGRRRLPQPLEISGGSLSRAVVEERESGW